MPKKQQTVEELENEVEEIVFLEKEELAKFFKQNEINLKNRSIYQHNGIIARTDGHPQLRKVVETRLKRLLKKAAIEKKIAPHSFRHTHTSLLIEAGVCIKEIQQRLGHSDINTTMNIYVHMTANMEEKASQQFSKLMKDLLL